MLKWIVFPVAILALIAAAFILSPRPGVQVIRVIFDRGAAAASQRLEALVPADVTTTTVQYDAADADAVMDIYRPPETAAGMPVIVWIHGGGFVSGRRGDVANYLKILAGQGFVVANIDYTIAPGARYPTPVRQASAALAFLIREGEAFGLRGTRFVLGGDSAGAQIAAQTAAIAANPDYAVLLGIDAGRMGERLAGAILFCGVYDISGMGQGGGILGWFVNTTGWAYSGTRDWRRAESFATFNFMPHLTAGFPPSFISAGNADPLAPQSVALARALEEAGVGVDKLFFPADHEPGLGHEYQFDLNTEAGRLAFDRMIAWLRSR